MQMLAMGFRKYHVASFRFQIEVSSCLIFAMVLGKLPVPGRPAILITVGQGPTALAVGAGGVVWTF